jgi:hypothetical protein
MDYGTDYEIDLVLWDPEPDIVEYAKDGGYRYVEYNSKDFLFHGHPDHRFIFHLYNCWQAGYEMSRCEYVFRSGSDQIMSQGFLHNAMRLIQEYEGPDRARTAFYHLYTLESWEGSKAAYGRPCSRHIMPKGWWDDIYKPDYERFEAFCGAMTHDSLMNAEEYPLALNHATRGWIPHCVGASWIQRRDTFERLGPMWNYVGPNGLTGDVEYFDRGEANGIPSLLIGNSFTLHRSKGESN